MAVQRVLRYPVPRPKALLGDELLRGLRTDLAEALADARGPFRALRLEAAGRDSDVMRRLAWVQFFSWFGLFCMWIYSTAAVTGHHFGATEPGSALYNEGANWVGVLFGAYNGFAMLAALLIPLLVRAIGLPLSHLVNLSLGGLGLLSFALIRDPQWLLLSMVGVGFAWASILSLPYAMLADSLPAKKMGVYMGIFNFFIVIPQLIAAATLGAILNGLLGGEPLRVIVMGGISFFVAGLCVLRARAQGSVVAVAPGH